MTFLTRSLLFLALAVGLAFADPGVNRHILVIGNDSYPGNELKNARNDARSVADTFASLGYKVTLQLDVNHHQMADAITNFASSLHKGDVALLYYSGHGFQINGENFLVPVDFKVISPSSAIEQGYGLSAVLEQLIRRGTTTQVVILDACRNNPFLATRSLRGGWAEFPTSAGTFLAFGTAPGSTASDNPAQPHGLFTQSFLKYVTSPLDIGQMLDEVRQDVIRSSAGMQVPWVATSLIGSLHLVPQLDASANAVQAPASPVTTAKLVAPRSASSGVGVPAPAVASTPAAVTAETDSVPVLLRQGVQLAERKNYDEAIRSLSAALAIDPRCGFALRLLGLIFHLIGRGEESSTAFDRALTANPADADAYYYRCLTDSQDNPESAVRDCEAAIGIRPDFARAHFALANALLASGHADAAYTEINKAIQWEPSFGLAYALRGKVLSALGRPGNATRDYQTAARLAMDGSQQ
jgi:Tfp pilus assembly protein PilF